MYSPKRKLRLFRNPSFNPTFTNPSLTLGSATSVVAQSPFAGGGNSYSFSASANAYITTPGTADWALGTGDFTIEWFGYQTSLTGFQRVFTVGDYSSANIATSIETNGNIYFWENGPYRYTSAAATVINTWYHWAIVRRNGTTYVYRNGTQLGGSYADTYDILNNGVTLVIGNTNTFKDNNGWVGYITNLRWVKGLAVYTGNFTAPTSALTATASANPYGGSNTVAIGAGYTKLLLVP